jgi:predicted anti-sigma-YlaC factor YlaD
LLVPRFWAMGELDENMACQELVEFVTAYLEGYLATAERACFEEHLATCSGCRTYLEQMRITLRALDRVPEQRISTEVREQLLHLYRAWHQL